MNFGSDEVFEKIEAAVSTGDESLYEEVLKIINMQAKSRLMGYYKVNEYDADDIIQEVNITFLKNAVKFILNSKEKCVAERNSWLIRVIDSKYYDFFRRNKGVVTNDSEWWDRQTEEKSVISAESAVSDEDREKIDEWIVNAISGLLNINTNVQNILAFIQNKIVVAFTYGLSNGKPQEVACEFNGMPLIKVYEITVESIEENLHMCKRRRTGDV